MADPYIGEIRLVGFNFAPRGWAFCDGQLLSIAQYSALFSLFGVMYGGDGRVTFGLPDLRGRVPMKFGQGPGLQNYVQGEEAGSETVTLINSEMPMHNHLVNATSNDGSAKSPNGTFLAGTASPIYGAAANGTIMNPQMIGLAGGNQPHENRQPFLVVNFIVALEGIFPSRN
ncbi:MAG TPA: tail fiber protein [Iamia sp.]|nr:tail fiber protein [Iamia sp.]